MHSPSAASSKDRNDDLRRRNQNRSSFDLEPNPFEQSFSNSRSDDASHSDHKPESNDSKPSTADDPPPKSKPADDTPKPVLPSLAALSSPSDGTYAWTDLTGSLRAGPLSPAMLQGPQQPQQSQTPRIPFDPSTFVRTGFTPIVGGPVSFPPPSPNTAAFLAMVTNNNAAAPTTQATITPNTLSAITGGILNQPQPQPQPNSSPPQSTAPQPAPYPYNPVQPQQQPNGSYPPASATAAANAAANGLFLLSQAHQELAKREEAQARAAADPPKRGSKRKSLDGPAHPSSATVAAVAAAAARVPNKRTRATAQNQRRRKASTGSLEDDESQEEDEMQEEPERHNPTQNSNGSGGAKKPETEEEKRRNFLERNRQAALKCRQRKKAWLAQLQAKVEFLSNENERLTAALVSSREEISRLNALLGGQQAAGPGGGPASEPVSVAVSLPGAGPGAKGVNAPPVGVVGSGRGYGY